jgi:hypothetical protein
MLAASYPWTPNGRVLFLFCGRLRSSVVIGFSSTAMYTKNHLCISKALYMVDQISELRFSSVQMLHLFFPQNSFPV